MSGIPDGLVHDHIVLLTTTKHAQKRICQWADEMVPKYYDYPKRFTGNYVLEYPLTHSHNKYATYVDIAYIDWFQLPTLLLEIKSAREPQSPSAWTRQVREYEAAANAPCILVIAHDLEFWMRQYLALAHVPVLDLRSIL
jgi:hypothetical protein